MGLWRSWERAWMAFKRSGVRTPSALHEGPLTRVVSGPFLLTKARHTATIAVRYEQDRRTSRQLPQHVHHFDRRQRRVEALVAGFGAGAVDGLFQRVARQ